MKKNSAWKDILCFLGVNAVLIGVPLLSLYVPGYYFAIALICLLAYVIDLHHKLKTTQKDYDEYKEASQQYVRELKKKIAWWEDREWKRRNGDTT